MAKILDGKKLAEKILINLEKEIKKKSLKLRLAVILVGENPLSQFFIRQKEKVARRIGIDFKLFKFPVKISFRKLKKEIEKITREPANNGIVIQLPLPMIFGDNEIKRNLAEEFLNLIPAEKDVDVLSEKSLGKFSQGILEILPPTVSGILKLLNAYKISLKGKNVVIVGGGRLVGFPLAIQLFREKATFSVVNEFTKNPSFFIKKADILISGVGKAGLISGKMIKKGAVVIDVGTTLKEGKLVGDVDFESVSRKAGYITPVPGGIGPMTVACLLENLVKINNRP